MFSYLRRLGKEVGCGVNLQTKGEIFKLYKRHLAVCVLFETR